MSRFTLALGIALLVVEVCVAAAIIATNERIENPWPTIVFAAGAGSAFIVSGLVAIARRPENRVGLYLAATGYLWFFGALGDSSSDWVFTIGFVLSGLLWVPFGALVLSYPTGRLETPLERGLPIATGILLTVPALVAALLDPSPAVGCDICADSAIAIADLPDAGAALDVMTSVFGLALIALVIGVLVRRWRRATPALRRLLWPVAGAGVAALLSIAAVVIANQVSEAAADALQFLFFASFAAVPVAFLLGVLRMRLARSSVSELVVSITEGRPLRDALADALGDSSLEISYWLDADRGLGEACWIDPDGRTVAEPATDGTRAVKLVEHEGVRVAALSYDAALDAEPELVDAVMAAAGMALRNERLHAELRAEVGFMNTVGNTAPSLLVNIGTDGRIRSINRAALDACGHDEDAVRGEHFWNVFIDPGERAQVIERFRARAPHFSPGDEYENTFTGADGNVRTVYWRSEPVTDERGRVLSIVSGGLDITERKRMEEEIRASRARIVRAEDEARRELERNLHDGAQQRLVALSVALRLVESKLTQDTAAAAGLLASAREELGQALAELRELARGIHPAVLTDRGLRPALEALAARAPVPVEVVAPADRFAPEAEAAAYYVVAEALTNVAKYADASTAAVRIALDDGVLVVDVADDGAGGADPAAGTGLRGLADRVAALDGTLSVLSPAGGGTAVHAEIPLRPGGDGAGRGS